MPLADYHRALDAPLPEEARNTVGFRDFIHGLRDRGAEIMEEGDRLLEWMTTWVASASPPAMRVVLRLFQPDDVTARAVLRTGAAKMKASKQGNQP
jgi:hypothetical protein